MGAGAAGISMALEWVGSTAKVLLLEGGGFDFERAMQDLYRGEIVGKPYFPLDAARLHYFGGTTAHWAGFCSTYDPIDFEVRPWVPHSGWPIRREELDPFYARAQHVLELGPYDYDATSWASRDADLVPLPLDQRVFWTKMWQFSPPTRFGIKYRNAIVTAPNVHLFTHANVCEVEANEGLTAVDGLRVRTLHGKELIGRARGLRARLQHHPERTSTPRIEPPGNGGAREYARPRRSLLHGAPRDAGRGACAGGRGRCGSLRGFGGVSPAASWR